MSLFRSSDLIFRSVLLATVIFLLIFLLKELIGSKTETNELLSSPVLVNTNVFGFVDDTLNQTTETVSNNETLSEILDPYFLQNTNVSKIAQISRNIFDVRKIRSGNTYHLFTLNDSLSTLEYFVYELNAIDYVVFDLRDSVNVYSGEKTVTIRKNSKSAIIKTSLFDALIENNASINLAVRLSKIFAWQIDFYRLQKGDNFKVIYEEEYVDNQKVGIGKVLGAYFSHYGKSYYAISFVQDSIYQFFDENGNSLRKEFLKMPIEFARITSRFSSRRLHPVLKVYRPHYGVDYAAPTGTPIKSVGDGTVESASYSGGNGNYIKIRHNSVYTTMYLHMSRFAKAIKRGTKVKQGQIIGYVGSTGLATAPHCHYIFYVNGTPVDPLKVELPPSHPVKANLRNAYQIQKRLVMYELEKVKLPADSLDQPPA
ncbi:peptidoglycan DD-metalloendopeptidase family protein [bacterium BMS3Abin03]|nr:peptidoglycan DD-metalloendopeptidase family protein [bacterium BMS3Abin03]